MKVTTRIQHQRKRIKQLWRPNGRTSRWLKTLAEVNAADNGASGTASARGWARIALTTAVIEKLSVCHWYFRLKENSPLTILGLSGSRSRRRGSRGTTSASCSWTEGRADGANLDIRIYNLGSCVLSLYSWGITRCGGTSTTLGT